jgi:phosphoglycerate-specific signal transduction histidine kinase
LEYLFPILIVLAFLFTLIRIEINTKKKLDNDERIIERLDLIINDLRKTTSKGEN